jgi:CheY-like chemotaxis protein
VLRREEVEPLEADPNGEQESAARTATLEVPPEAETESREPDSPAVEAPAAAAVEPAAPRAPAPIAPAGAGPIPAPASIAPLPVSPAPRPPQGSVAPQPPAQRRALIAEDSIAARVFLTRMLEREGFAVRAVITATELFDELMDDSWSLLCIDVELPDGRNDEVLEGVVARLGGRVERLPIVALVRDTADVATARAAGVTRTLRKPFDRESLLEILTSLGLSAKDER